MELNRLAMMGFKTKQEFAYDAIREAIVTGELAPDERLIISNLAVDLGVSEIPVREALKRLHAEGLIVNCNQGFSVSPISSEDFVELLGVRLELEGMAIRRSTEKIDNKGLEEIEMLLQNMEEANRIKDSATYGRLDKELHSLLPSFCGVDVLIKAIHDAWNHSERARSIFRIMPWRAETSLKEHWEIFAAMKNRQAQLAEKLLISHKKQAFDLFIEQLANSVEKTNYQNNIKEEDK
jgi:DNA-binding GntR family transcriptional regulator